MASIQPKTLCEIADDVAFESRLPWRVENLRTEARKACRSEAIERRAASAGLSGDQASALVRRLVHEQVSKASSQIDALPPGQSTPTPGQIDAALEAFTVEQWRSLAETFHLDEADRVISYVDSDENRHRLIRGLGVEKWKAIMGATARRATDLWLSENRSKLVSITNPYWADRWWKRARYLNRKNKGHYATGRSRMEDVSHSKTAARLSKHDHQIGRDMKVNDREVRRWRERAERLPYEQYAAKVGASDEEQRAVAFIDYWASISKKHQRKQQSRRY